MTNWFIRCGKGSADHEVFIASSIVALGWGELGNLKNLSEKEIETKYKNIFFGSKEGTVRSHVRQIYKFVHEFKKGEYVVTYDRDMRFYRIGKIIGDYEFKEGDELGHQRKVEWSSKVSRDSLSQESVNTLGAIMTLFSIKEDVMSELLKASQDYLSSKEPQITTEIEESTISAGITDNAFDLVQKKILELDWEEMQELVAGLLRAMGYKTRVSPKGSDLGKDIIASSDGLGLSDPRILVEVKHRKNSMGAPEVRNFISTLRTHQDRGLYVSTGGFTVEARYEAERSDKPVTLVGISEFTELVIKNYDNFDTDAVSILPLKKLYLPQ